MAPIQGIAPQGVPIPGIANAGSAGNASTTSLPTATGGAPGAATASPAAAGSAASQVSADQTMMLLNMMSSLVQMLVQTAAKSGGATASNASATPPASAGSSAAAKPATAGAGNAGAAGAPAPARAPGRAKIAVIDDFNSNQNGFQHGTEVSNAASSAAGGADVQRLNGQGPANIANSLRQVLNNAKSGNKVDVVNISQFVQGNQQEIQGLIQELRQQGIPVVVAAGNNGPNQRNGIGGGSALTAGNGTNQSGPGNVQGNGRTTSFAAADVSGRLAKLISSGVSAEEAIRQVGAS